MKHAKHVPGPWEVLDGKLVHARGYLVAKLLGERQHGKANADLIAAAPLLLAALEVALKVGVARLCEVEEIVQIEQAIAKAKGDYHENT